MILDTRLSINIWRFAMVAAPLLIAVSQFFTQNGLVTATAGWLQVLAFTLWMGLLLMVAAIGFPLSRMPRIELHSQIDNALLLVSHTLIAFAAGRTDDSRGLNNT